MRGAPTLLSVELRELAKVPGLPNPDHMTTAAEALDDAAFAVELSAAFYGGDQSLNDALALRFVAALTPAIREQMRGRSHYEAHRARIRGCE